MTLPTGCGLSFQFVVAPRSSAYNPHALHSPAVPQKRRLQTRRGEEAPLEGGDACSLGTPEGAALGHLGHCPRESVGDKAASQPALPTITLHSDHPKLGSHSVQHRPLTRGLQGGRGWLISGMWIQCGGYRGLSFFWDHRPLMSFPREHKAPRALRPLLLSVCCITEDVDPELLGAGGLRTKARRWGGMDWARWLPGGAGLGRRPHLLRVPGPQGAGGWRPLSRVHDASVCRLSLATGSQSSCPTHIGADGAAQDRPLKGRAGHCELSRASEGPAAGQGLRQGQELQSARPGLELLFLLQLKFSFLSSVTGEVLNPFLFLHI